jgi:hypothetical protein
MGKGEGTSGVPPLWASGPVRTLRPMGEGRGQATHCLGATIADGAPTLPLLQDLEAERAHPGPGRKHGVHPRIVRETSSPGPGTRIFDPPRWGLPRQAGQRFRALGGKTSGKARPGENGGAESSPARAKWRRGILLGRGERTKAVGGRSDAPQQPSFFNRRWLLPLIPPRGRG